MTDNDSLLREFEEALSILADAIENKDYLNSEEFKEQVSMSQYYIQMREQESIPDRTTFKTEYMF